MRQRAHPRSRGEHGGTVTTGSPARGSSPLARGALLELQRAADGVGLIPARAGSTAAPATTSTGASAHPRSRGEHLGGKIGVMVAAGSSPLARGAPRRRVPAVGRRGLIPARAGSTGSRSACHPGAWAHPRSRGEHSARAATSARRRGSSPLARGAQSHRHRRSECVGLIPARAGSTGRCVRDAAAGSAHPRSRGEHCAVAYRSSCVEGSSPLARGALGLDLQQPHPAGLIPARAGSTRSTGRRSCRRPAHPRSRGEHSDRRSRQSCARGSSPLARGARRLERVGPVVQGLIPARAGSTLAEQPRYLAP